MKVREKGRNRGRKVARGGRWEGWKGKDGREEYMEDRIHTLLT
jgi:hypothetical protein